jgi:hypothetical protein
MSTASKAPGEPPSAPAREYKTHFELWEEATAIHDADAPPVRNGNLRPWTKPVLTTKPVSLPPRRKILPPAEIVQRPWKEIPIAALYLAMAVGGAFLAILVMRPWEYSAARPSSKPIAKATAKVVAHAKPAPKKLPQKVAVAAPKPAPKLTAVPKVVAMPKAAPSVAIAAKPAVVAPAKMPVASSSTAAASHVAAVSIKPAAQPSVAIAAPKLAAAPPPIIPLAPPEQTRASTEEKPAPLPPPSVSTKVASAPPPIQHPVVEASPAESSVEEVPEPTSGDEQEADELAPIHAMLLESAIRTQLASAGFTDLGVSMTQDGDVYLNGTFLNIADQDKAIAMIRQHHGVRDIYFSGSVWHDLNTQHGQAATPAVASLPNPMSKAEGAEPSTPRQQAGASAPESKTAPARHVKIAHSAEFPVTAAEEPAPVPRYAAPVQPTAVPTPAPKPHSIFPFRWFNKLSG